MTDPRYGLALLLGVLAAELLGCGGSNAAPGPSADLGSVSLQELPGRLVHAICDNIGACCESAAIHFDLATCQLNAPSFVGQLLVDGRSPSISYDPAVGARCLAAYESLIKGCSSLARATPKACEGLFTGTLPVGQACSTTHECAKPSPGESAYCASGSSGSEVPVCIAFPIAHAQLGDACHGTCDGEDRCSASVPSTEICFLQDGLQCHPLEHTCRRLGAPGEACGGSDGMCVPEAFCSDHGRCEAVRDSGSCLNVPCSATSYCESTTRQCTPKLADGAPCKSSAECSGGSCSEFDVCATIVSVLATATSCAGVL